MMFIAQTILGLAYSAMIVVFAFGFAERPTHAMIEGLTTIQRAQAAVWAAGLCIMGLVIVIGPLGRGELWAWWVTILCGLLVLGGFVGPYVRMHRPLQRADRIGLIALTAAFTVGLMLARLAIRTGWA